MKRNFDNWLEAYLTYTNDGFVPEQFNKWSGLSAIAGALERKVWIPWSDTFSYYPNMYVLLVALPGVGKSTALNKAVELLQELNQRVSTLNFIPSQVTEAKFIELMGNSVSFEIGTKHYMQSAGYYFASEASNSLKNVYGDFTACLTDFYDCPKTWEKATKKDDRITLQNVCLNLLAGSTFDYLSKLVTDENIMGGFASRLTYVVHREKLVRDQKFQGGGASHDASGARSEYRKKLVEDLIQIHKMVGPFTATKEYGAAWEEWYPAFEKRRQEIESEKMQSLLVRTNTNVMKTSMLFSAARGSDRLLTIEDWDNAMTLVEANEKELPGIFRESKAMDTQSQEGLNQAIFRAFELKPELDLEVLRMDLVLKGFNPMMVNPTLDMMKKGNQFKVVSSSGTSTKVNLLTNANHYL